MDFDSLCSCTIFPQATTPSAAVVFTPNPFAYLLPLHSTPSAFTQLIFSSTRDLRQLICFEDAAALGVEDCFQGSSGRWRERDVATHTDPGSAPVGQLVPRCPWWTNVLQTSELHAWMHPPGKTSYFDFQFTVSTCKESVVLFLSVPQSITVRFTRQYYENTKQCKCNSRHTRFFLASKQWNLFFHT